VAGYVDVIEINSTFYRPPDARTAASWAQRTADCPGFFFTAKIHQDVTHRGEITPEMVRAFHEGLRPLTAEGRLKHLLAQFRYDFADNGAARAHLERLRSGFGDITHLTLELRHISWEAPDALAFLGGLGVSVANLDYPTARNSFNLPQSGVGEHAYLRLHGRNAAAWFDKGAGRDQTYNYLYSRAELEGIRGRAWDIAKMSSSLTVVANNHYQGKEMVNALQLKSMLAGQKVPAPAGLLEKYPELREYAAN
jgi:uncharacterized protein YecE (DUF72 family)